MCEDGQLVMILKFQYRCDYLYMYIEAVAHPSVMFGQNSPIYQVSFGEALFQKKKKCTSQIGRIFLEGMQFCKIGENLLPM